MRLAAFGGLLWLSACGSSLPPVGRATCSLLPDAIELHSSSGSARIHRSPFFVQYLNAQGQTVLASSTSGNVPLSPGVTYTEPLGSDSIPDLTLYAPLSFEIGGGAIVQFPAGPWTGNQIMGAQAGLEYAATEVSDASCAGDSARMSLATNDPAGRTIQLRISPDGALPAVFHLDATLEPALGVSGFSDSFSSSDDEQFYGFGGRHNALSQRGESFPQWVEQENFSAGPVSPYVAALPGTGGNTYLFPNGPTAAYYPQALFVSSHPYGFLLENSELARHRLAYGSSR